MFSGFDEQDIPDSTLDRVLFLQNMLLSVAENGTLNEFAYSFIRRELMHGENRSLLPEVIRTCRDKGSVWGYLKGVASGSGSWDARRNHIYETFTSLLDHLEGRNSCPADSTISDMLSSFDTEGVHRAWERALQRRHEDPEGAITAARALLETV